MAGLSISRSMFEAGDFPMVCASSGRPADTRFGVRIRTARGEPTVNGLLPFSFVSQRRMRVLVRFRDALIVAVFVIVALLTVTHHGHGARLIGAPLIIVALALNIIGALRSVEGRLDATNTFVRLRGVHPRFVAAVLDASRPAASTPAPPLT